MTCDKCRGITKEVLYIGYYLCRVNTTDDIKYGVKPTAKCCCQFKEKKQKRTTDETRREIQGQRNIT